MKVAIAYSTKNRTEFTKQTLPRIMDEAKDNFDLYWLDGSDTADGKQFPAEFASNWRREHNGEYPLKEMHYGVGGGAAAVIQAALNYLGGKDYDYVGLIENDVLLEKGWFEKTMALFDREPNVGIVSARSFSHRVIERRGDYAVMADVGAGMCIMRKDLAYEILLNWRRPALWELQVLCKALSGHEYPVPKFALEDDPELKKHWACSEDWYWPIVAMYKGYSTLAVTPSLSKNLDDPDGVRDPSA